MEMNIGVIAVERPMECPTVAFLMIDYISARGTTEETASVTGSVDGGRGSSFLFFCSAVNCWYL